MPLPSAWLLAPYRFYLPVASGSLSIEQQHVQSLVECRKMTLALWHPSQNEHYSRSSGSRKHHATRCFETSYRREDSVMPSMFIFGKDCRRLQIIAKMFLILGGVQTLQGSAEALASTTTTQGVNDILGGDFKGGFVSALLLIFFSELGDKTFFIAALLATRKSNVAVFTGTFGALVSMTFISVVLGQTFHYIDGVLPFSLGDDELLLDDLAAVGLLIYFGISSLIEAGSMEGSKAEEEQQEAELAIAGVDGEGIGMQADAKTVIATFALVFAAEWGDKSFFSTIALAAASSPLGVVTGAIAGHGAATVLAVLGGSMLGTFVSEKIIAYTGGILFLIFAGITLAEVISGSK